MTCFIHFTGNNPIGFVQLLVSLQPQLDPDSDIYIVDSSLNREGLRLSRLYGSTRCYIFVEVGKYDWKTAYSFAEQNMRENKQEGILHLSESLVISSTFISNMKKANKTVFDIVLPVILDTPYPQFPGSFKWYNPPAKELKVARNIRIECFYKKAVKKERDMIGVLEQEAVVMLLTPELKS